MYSNFYMWGRGGILRPVFKQYLFSTLK
uniref:Uncharacterized protein n=1 Tax=Anguilla anguilla TaxID=7936 RepID=A0A0E9XMQ4_ANGAN